MLRKALVSSKIAYGISVYGDGSKVGFNALMKIENACARVVLGAINSTPIHTLWSEMGDSPLNYKREWITMRDAVRMIMKDNALVNEMIASLQTGTVFRDTQRTRLILANINVFTKIKKVVPAIPPVNLVVCLNFGGTTKALMNELSVKREFYKMQTKYFAHLQVYTDASVSDDRVGVEIYIPALKKEKMLRVNCYLYGKCRID